jgi:flagellar biosynthesis/type III secretory pathway chaperone
MMINEKLAEVEKIETELAEVLLGLLKQQQNAIVHFRDAELTSLVEQQQNIIRPLEALEKERMHFMREGPSQEEGQSYRQQLKSLVRQILEVNNQNKVLLENSLKFIHQNLRIMTDDYTKQLIDAKI